jgi:phosphoglycolate phosphatase-like HAD superfamily hydrolase
VDSGVSAVIFDFDGVIVESNDIRTEGFRTLLERKRFPADAIEKLIVYHKANGGLSRYHKLRYFYEKIMERQIDEVSLQGLCDEFSSIVKSAVTDAPYVKGAREFLEENGARLAFFLISGSDQEELRDICRARKIDGYFREILGSPVDKKTNLKVLLERHRLPKEKTVFVGDSVNDWEAANAFQVPFVMRDSGNCGGLIGRVPVIRDLTELLKN